MECLDVYLYSCFAALEGSRLALVTPSAPRPLPRVQGIDDRSDMDEMQGRLVNE